MEGATEESSDRNKVSSRAKEALEWAVTLGIIGGKGKTGAPKSELKIDPQGKASRFECACMIANLLQKNEQKRFQQKYGYLEIRRNREGS